MAESTFKYKLCEKDLVLEIEIYDGEIVAEWKMNIDIWLKVLIEDFLDDLSKGN
jgi:hypothetical protein